LNSPSDSAPVGRQPAAADAPPPAWSDVHVWRQKFRRQFDDIHRIPIAPSLIAWLENHIRTHARPGAKLTLLDVGASDRQLERKLVNVASLVAYKSQDIDRGRPHDYYDTATIRDTFDLIVSSEVIEHLDAATKISFVQDLHRLVAPGGWVVLTTPNAQHPTVFWRDFTHICPIHHLDLAGLLGRAGFTDVHIVRLARMNLMKKLRAWWYRGLLRMLHCDYAQTILAAARKTE